MEAIVGMISDQLKYESHEISGKTIMISVESVCNEAECPYCGARSTKVHSKYVRKLQDLPIQGKKVRLLLKRKKYFCMNDECSHRTFAEGFDFFDGKATKTKRLQEEILRVSLTQSSVAASRYLKSSVADVGKSTICNLLKKGRKKQ